MPGAPVLRPSSVLEDPETEDDRVAIYLDNQFRLLREDMIYEMREELQIALGNKKRKHRGFVVEDLVLLDIFCGPDARRYYDNCTALVRVAHVGEKSIVQPPSSQPTRLVTSLEADPYQDLRPTLGVQNSEPLKLDKSQASSLLSSLKQRVSLIQGPPGTGKSFIGALLAKALHDFTEEIILVVCYTNHALDQFLEDLLNIGIPESSINQNGMKVGKSPAEWKEIDALKNKSETLIHQLNSIFDEYKSSNVLYDDLLAHIEFEDHAYFQAFYVPNPQSSDTGMLQVGKKGRAVDSRYLLNQWERGWDADRVAEFYTTAKAYNDCREDLDRKFGQRNAAVLKSKRIIGCTTTAAAKYSAEIRAASPGILLVEEAGEILESHILTALGENTKQLILIGDHKQLRPKVNHYQLTVEKGAGYDLNRSLFERLVLKGYPHHTLSQQHRMRPEISALVRRLTYPDLVDAARTKGRPDLRGIRDNLVFINHSSPEDDMPELADRRDLNSTSSKQNTYEAEMVLKILHKLRGMLKEDNDPILNDLDSYDLVRAGLLPAATAQMSKRPIRLATIDNYQGEESDIVIRLNVLLSRARNALIMIGNADTFLHARKGSELWGQLFNMLKHDQHVYDGLPVRCERHPSRTALLHAPSDFDDHVPDGGCQEPCDVMLNCNVHRCPSKCHQLYDHSKMPCEYAMTDLCSKDIRYLGSVIKVVLSHQKRDADDLAHAKRMAELDEQMAGEMQKLKDAQLAEERANAIRQKEKDVASIADRTSSGGSTPALSTPVTSKDTKTSNPDPAKPSAKSPAASRTAPASSAKFPTISSGAQLTPKESPSEREWIRRKTIDGASNDAIDAIMEMTGLEDVKSQVLRIKDKIDLAQRQNQALKERFNAVLLGNPGQAKRQSLGITPNF
ncbi:NFX1-type zinc finger-containing protein 1 [Grifola frondosa]|uniref:NFX1-type zinc finger-containing protein 1 n=1 Tax=Grifola frondosa TaxID=5627 RepID=A0A1C7MN29_GRIFR|nr:NFX1-type zinc finger-containing protein 1 [Grifola frondosa]